MYKIFTSLSGQQFIVANEGLTFIPSDEGNKDYQEYLKWVAEGNTAEEWVVEQ